MKILDELKNLQDKGYVRLVQHRTLPLILANYTPVVQYSKLFGDYSLLRKTRGLIVDHDSSIVALPFEKFFNYEEHSLSELPIKSAVTVTEKLDGSLLIVTKYRDQLVFATRGSFYSDQAIRGANLFNKNYSSGCIEEGKTYLFELIGPSNRIVVSYPEDKIVFLGRRDSSNSPILIPESHPFEEVRSFNFDGNIFGKDLYERLKGLNTSNEEGFVISTDDDWRCKVKFEDYVKLHRIVTGVSTKTIWQYLMEEKDILILLEHTPDEFNAFVHDTIKELQGQFDTIANKVKELAEVLKDFWIEDNKQVAYFLKDEESVVKHATFAMLRGKDWKTGIWEQLQPVYRQPFEEQ